VPQVVLKAVELTLETSEEVAILFGDRIVSQDDRHGFFVLAHKSLTETLKLMALVVVLGLGMINLNGQG
jgi:hypothetical protein